MAKKTKWVIEFTSRDPSRDHKVSYKTREEAVEVAGEFVKKAAQEELGAYEWDPEDEAPKMLQEILEAIADGDVEEAIFEWLEYQNAYTPEERIAIGPSGSVSDHPHDFASER